MNDLAFSRAVSDGLASGASGGGGAVAHGTELGLGGRVGILGRRGRG